MYIKIFHIIFLLAWLISQSTESVFSQAKITKRLQNVMNSIGDDDKVNVVIAWSGRRVFTDEEKKSFDFLPRLKKQSLIVAELKNYADIQQRNFAAILEQGKLDGEVESTLNLWLFSRYACKIGKNLILRVSELPEISFIDHDPEFPGMHTFDAEDAHNTIAKSSASIAAAPEWGVSKIKAPTVWQIGFQGQGVLVAVLDDGCNYNHSDLANHLWDGSSFFYNGQQLIYHGWDAVDNDNNPIGGNHGTLVTGIVVGDGTTGKATGVAPGTTVMIIRNATDAATRETKLMAGFQFLVDMKSIYGETFQLPDIVTMSQTMKFLDVPDYDAWRNLVLGFYDLGILHTNSAGNLGASPTGDCDTYPWCPILWNVGAPANCPPPWLHPDQLPPVETGYPYLGATMAIGATKQDDSIRNDSGRGPTAWENIQSIHDCQNIINSEWWQYLYDTVPQNERKPLIKPDIVAPGDNLYSTSSSGGYALFQQTSAATPHVAGTVALLLSANANLSPADLSRVLQVTAVEFGIPGKDNVYGAGRIDAYQATLLALAYSNKSISTTATASNNGRRMVKTSDNRYHLVFESGVASGGNVLSEILYRRSNSGGTSWETPTRLSAGDEQNRYPSIVERVDGTTKKLYTVWQRKTGTNTYNILFRHFNGSSWEMIQTITSGISLASDPLPVLAISTPSTSFEMMVVYRTSSGLKTRRSTSTNGTSWESEITVTTSTSARNPNVTYSSNDYANFDAAWDNGSQVYHRHFYGGNWSSEINVSSGLSTANTHEYPSYARGSTNNRHVVWQATDQTQGNRKVIFHSYNLNTSTYTKFYSSSVNYLRPNIAGIGSGGAFVLWHDDSGTKNIRYARFNGSYWETSSAGVVYASNGIDASVATMNPPGTSIKGVYRSADSSPYSLSLGGFLSKPEEAAEEITYSRQIIFGQNEDAALALRIAAPMIDSEVVPLIFPELDWEDSLTTETVIDKLTFDFIVPANAEAMQFETEVYANKAGQLLEEDKTTLEIYLELVDRATDASLETSLRELVSLDDEIKSTKTAKIALANHRGVAVRLRPVLAGLDLNKARGALVHVYGDDGFGQRDATKPKISTGTNVSRLSISAWPNPFNPATQIHFTLPSAGLVSVRIFDVNGRLVREWREEHRVAGEHVILWDGRDLAGQEVASGVYISQISVGRERQIAKMTLIR